MSFLHKGNPVPLTHSQHHRHQTSSIQNPIQKQMHAPKTAKQVCAFPGLIRYYRKSIKNLVKMARLLTLLTCQKAKFEWTPIHHTTHTTFLMVKQSVTQAPILCYPDPTKQYLVCTDASDDAYGAHLLQEHDGMESPITFLLHTFMDTEKMENHRTRSLWSVLCSHKMKLLPPGSWSYHMQWPQTTGKISQWKEHQKQSKKLGIKICNI